MKRITVLGSTGSIGTQTLEVAAWRGYRVAGLAGGTNAGLLVAQAQRFRPEAVACSDTVARDVAVQLPEGIRLLTGPDGIEEIARLEVDTVVAAIPGFAGLAPTRAALESGRHVALANKEAMVVAGPLMWAEARRSGADITPVDSEHSALFQCLLGERQEDVHSLVLTASGGPFRTGPADLSKVTPEQALDHPTWSMGAKVTIDSATLFNKGLEVLEAHFLFELPLDRIEVVVHPQSLVHGLVRFRDGSIKAQIGAHDMRLPIQYALSFPERPATPLEPLPLDGCWEFHSPDHARFPSLGLAYRAGRLGGTTPAALNAADEVAVGAFLSGLIPFSAIPRILDRVIEETTPEVLDWTTIRTTDAAARARAHELCRQESASAPDRER